MSPGSVLAWGAGGNYSIGDGGNADRYTPVPVSGLNNAVQLAGSGDGGGDSSYALLADGTVRAWGYNAFAQLGDGTRTSRRTAVRVSGLTGVRAIAAGVDHGLALLSNGTVMAWGSNGSGQVGDGTTTMRLSPVRVSGLSGAVAIAAGDNHSLAVLSNGTVMAWGANGNGQLGTGQASRFSATPVRVSGLGGVTALAAGNADSFALLSNGTMMAWGGNGSGQLGDGTTTERHTPVPVPGLSGVTAIAAGGIFNDHSMALLSGGSVMAWGRNAQGELGDGSTTDRHVPVAVRGVSGAVAITAGTVHSAALLANGTAMAWGGNAYGQLGNGTHSTTFGGQPVPAPVAGLRGATDIEAGESAVHTMAIVSGLVPPPVLGKSVDVKAVSGTVLIKGPHGFVPLTGARQIAVGSTVDTSRGRVRLTAAANARGATQTADFYEGTFLVGQRRGKALTTLRLMGGNFASCSRPASDLGPVAKAARRRPRRHVWGSGSGSYSTSGNSASATVRGTIWLTEDDCEGTLIRVQRGTVVVTDLVRHKTIIVHAPGSYFAAKHP
jgi:alpha-tubulin suppressor-like RCC1 family protein